MLDFNESTRRAHQILPNLPEEGKVIKLNLIRVLQKNLCVCTEDNRKSCSATCFSKSSSIHHLSWRRNTYTAPVQPHDFRFSKLTTRVSKIFTYTAPVQPHDFRFSKLTTPGIQNFLSLRADCDLIRPCNPTLTKKSPSIKK